MLKLRVVILLLGLSLAVQAKAGPIIVLPLAEGQKVSTKIEAGFAKAYDFVTQTIPDQEDRSKCPITVQFADLKGQHLGFAPFNQEPCRDTLILDQSLTQSWTSQIVLVHELTHLLRYQSNVNEESWLSEGLATFMEISYVGVWPKNLEQQIYALDEFKLPLQQRDFHLNSPAYATAFFLFHFLQDHLGKSAFIKEIATSPHAGWDNIESSAKKMAKLKNIYLEEHLDRKSLWTHFALALLVNDPSYANFQMLFINGDYEAVKDLKKTTAFANSNKVTWQPWTIRFRKEPLSEQPSKGFYRFIVDTDDQGNTIDIFEFTGKSLSSLAKELKLVDLSYDK